MQATEAETFDVVVVLQIGMDEDDEDNLLALWYWHYGSSLWFENV